MRRIPTRQVHLDFHTSELIPDVGARFDKAQFQQALRLGNLNSITVFAKCHHGWCYYPTAVGRVHPTLRPGFDLTGAMIDAAHEIGVDAPIYITLGWSAQDAERHPDWLMRDREGRPYFMNSRFDAAPDDPRPFCSWLCLCPSGAYAAQVLALTEEICRRYPRVDGLFYDIVYLHGACYCENCLAGMRAAGLDPDNPADAHAYYVQLHQDFAAACRAVLHRYHPEATLFFNSGGADIYLPEYHASQTHFEMEDLPTAWGGYDKMAPRASFMRRYPKDILGMTGKFHTDWGEFGGYKNPDALKFELCMMGMQGVRCSVGDQMPPDGRMDLETYRLIGEAYRYFERIEPWCYDEQSTTRLGVYLSGDAQADQGLHSILMERQLDFEVVIPGDDLSRFDALILPDCVAVPDEEAARLAAFPGGVLFTGESLLKDGAFQLDAGVRYEGPSPYDVDYLKAEDALERVWVHAPFLCYQSAARAVLTDGQPLASLYEPYFSRTYAHYCSHKYTPYRPEPSRYTGASRKGNRIYFAHKLCRMYHQDGAQIFRDVLVEALRLLYRPVCAVELPSGGRVRLTRQPDKRRYVLHLAYGVPVQRGRTSVIEDLPSLHQIPAAIRLDAPIRCVRTVPDGVELPFAQQDGLLRFTVPDLRIHQAVELQER